MNKIRLDGRACNEIRPIKIKSNIFKNFVFSTEISIGATKILSYMIENNNYEKIYDYSVHFLNLGLVYKKTQVLDSISKFLINISKFIITSSIIKFSFFIIEDDGNIEFALCNCITRLLMASKKVKFEIIFNSICVKKNLYPILDLRNIEEHVGFDIFYFIFLNIKCRKKIYCFFKKIFDKEFKDNTVQILLYALKVFNLIKKKIKIYIK